MGMRQLAAKKKQNKTHKTLTITGNSNSGCVKLCEE